MPRTRGPGLLAIFYGVVAAVLTAVWAVGLYAYWWQNWGIDTPLAAILMTAWWPFSFVYYGTLLLLENKGKIRIPGILVWGLLPMWPFLYHYGYVPNWGFINHRWRYVALYWYPLLVAAILLVKYFNGTSRAVQASGRFLNRYFKVILIVLGVGAGSLVLYGLLFTKWTLIGVALGIPIIILAFNWIRTIALGFDNADAGFVPGEINEIPYYDGTIAAPQRMHPIGIPLTALERARRLQWGNPLLGESMPKVGRVIWNVFRFLLLITSLWIVIHGLAIRIETATFPLFPFEISRFVIAVIFMVTFIAIAFGGKIVKPLWIVITAPVWSIPILWGLVIFTGYWSWWALWPITMIPHVIYTLAEYSRTLFGFTDNSIFVTVVIFHWWGVSTRRMSADAKAFKQDNIQIKRLLFWKYGSFDPGLLQLGQDELVVATHLPHPEKFKWALAFLQMQLR